MENKPYQAVPDGSGGSTSGGSGFSDLDTGGNTGQQQSLSIYATNI